MAGLHAMLDESNNVMVRIRKHIADGALDILDVLHTMALLRALPNTNSILVVELSGEAENRNGASNSIGSGAPTNPQ